MNNNDRVLVIGATRGTGYQIAQRLLGMGYRVRVLARNRAKARQRFGASVEVVEGDVTQPETLFSALADVDHLVYTAAVTRRFAGQESVKATVYDGVLHAIAAAEANGFAGRFLLMGALGTTRGSPLSLLLNLVKGNTLRWRRQAEEALRRSALDHTIIHAGILSDDPGGQRPVEIGQEHYPMWPFYRISRSDVAEIFVRALDHPNARNTTFDAVWARDRRARSWSEMFDKLVPDG